MPDTLLQLSPHCHICLLPRYRHQPGASGYSRAMRNCLLFTLAFGAGGAALAQSAPTPPTDREAMAEMSSAQKRIELRNVLSAGRNGEPAASAADTAPVGRQLSQQERAEMREQLRQFQPVAAPRPRRP